MNPLRLALPALCLIGIVGSAVYAQSVTPSPGTAPAGHPWHERGHPGGLWHVLRQLNLSAEQQTQIKSIFQQAKGANEALRTSIRANLQTLAITAPSDPSYPGLIATQKANASARIQAASDIKTQIYAVLTPAQIAAIPGIVAAEQAAWKAKVAGWRSQHPEA